MLLFPVVVRLVIISANTAHSITYLFKPRLYLANVSTVSN